MATAKKPAAKTAAKKNAAPTVDSRLNALEKRITHLEEHDIVTKAEGLYGTTRAKVTESYNENPALTIVIGLGVLIVLLLIIT